MMRLSDIGSGISDYSRSVLSRVTFSAKQVLFAKFFLVGLAMAFGAGGVIAGFPLLGLMVMEQAIIGIIISALTISLGAMITIGGYLWFTL
jgi:hypothetical protein